LIDARSSSNHTEKASEDRYRLVSQRYGTAFLSDLHEVAAYQSGVDMAKQRLLFRRWELHSDGPVQRAAGQLASLPYG